MKTLFKLLGGLIIGGLLGLVIGGLIVVIFTDTTWSEYISKYYDIELGEGVKVFLVAVLSMIASFAILVPIHELGHLICGLHSGYKFVSFRVFNYTLMKENGRFRIKKFAVAGTGGQCLLSPPDLPLDKIPTGLYNFGGILANIVVFAIVLPFMWLDLNPFVAEALGVFLATDALMILLNGIPMQAGGVGNDGYNIKILRSNMKSKLGIINQLRANALIQQGYRPKDMPEELFAAPVDIDYRNPLELSIPLMISGRLIDRMRYEEALDMMEEMYSHKEEIMQLYQKEIASELAFLYMRTGQVEKARRLFDKDLRKYIEAYRKMMSSKERILTASYLYLDNDLKKAKERYNELKNRKDEYLLKGEVKSDIALMEDMLEEYEKVKTEQME